MPAILNGIIQRNKTKRLKAEPNSLRKEKSEKVGKKKSGKKKVGKGKERKKKRNGKTKTVQDIEKSLSRYIFVGGKLAVRSNVKSFMNLTGKHIHIQSLQNNYLE